MMTKDQALDKIRKLLSVANDGRGNENEAAIAAMQAERLMRKFQLESADIVLEEIEKEESFDQGLEDVAFEAKKYTPKRVTLWVGWIAIGIGRAFMTKVDIVNTSEGVKVRFSGYAPDVMLSRWVYKFLCETVYRLSREQVGGDGMSAAKSFRSAAAIELQNRLFAMAEDRTQEIKASETGMALVVIDKKLARVEEMFGVQKTKEHKISASDANAFRKGKQAGREMNIPTNRPIGRGAEMRQIA